GRLQQLALQLPPDWEVEQVDTLPDDLLSHWRVLPEGAASVLHVMLKRVLTAPGSIVLSDDAKSSAASSARLTIRLRPAVRQGAAPGLRTGVPLPLPDLVPLRARWREGGLGIDYDKTLLEAGLNPRPPYQGGVGLPSPPSEEDCPWGKQLPDDYLPFRGEPF